jgi:lambda family phage minor tail protein L
MAMNAMLEELQKLTPSALIELFDLDTTSLGGDVFRFHAGINGVGGSLIWQTNTYSPFPIKAEGFEWNGTGTSPRPKITVANITGIMSALVREFDDLVGAKLTRRLTHKKFLDAANFPSGINADANPLEEQTDVWFVDRKAVENSAVIQFELASAMDLQGLMLPKRQIIQNLCTWRYRSDECGYAGGAVADKNDNPTSVLANDDCGLRIRSCKLRFGATGELPFGGFPSAGLVRV